MEWLLLLVVVLAFVWIVWAANRTGKPPVRRTLTGSDIGSDGGSDAFFLDSGNTTPADAGTHGGHGHHGGFSDAGHGGYAADAGHGGGDSGGWGGDGGSGTDGGGGSDGGGGGGGD